jgi:hypothetical protein
VNLSLLDLRQAPVLSLLGEFMHSSLVFVGELNAED